MYTNYVEDTPIITLGDSRACQLVRPVWSQIDTNALVQIVLIRQQRNFSALLPDKKRRIGGFYTCITRGWSCKKFPATSEHRGITLSPKYKYNEMIFLWSLCIKTEDRHWYYISGLYLFTKTGVGRPPGITFSTGKLVVKLSSLDYYLTR